MTWSYEEFEERLRAYWTAANARANKLLRIFFALIGTALVALVLMEICVIPKLAGSVVLVGVLVGFGLLAAYIVVTARSFHKVRCVLCVHCGKSLLTIGEDLEYHAEDGLERPEVLECPKCHRVVVAKSD